MGAACERQACGSVRPELRVLLAGPRGLCAGVTMAIETLEYAIQRFGPPIYVFHYIAHNNFLVTKFRMRGIIFVDSIGDIPEQAVALISAHGASPDVHREIRERRIHLIDATCPLVAKVHQEVRRFAAAGFHIILIGHPGHDEVVGTAGESPDLVHVVSTLAEIEALHFREGVPLAYVTQTTLSMDETRKMVAALQSRFPGIVGPSKDDICYASQNRQEAVRSLAREADIAIILGSQNSSNSQRLREVAETAGIPAHLIEDEVETDWALV